jgi:hypothetical protein
MSNEGRICPQCSYQRQPKDLAPDYECPRCGIIYAKYRPPEPKPAKAPQTAAPPPPAESAGTATAHDDGEPSYEPASPLRRALAGIYTFGLLVLYVVPLKFFFLAGFRISNPPGSIGPWAMMAKARTWDAVYAVVVILFAIHAFFLRPWLDGRTWGQAKFGLEVRPMEVPAWGLSTKDHLLRFAGNLIALCTFPVTLAGLLYALIKKRNDPGIADRLAKTRQYAIETPLPFRANFGKACFPLCIALIVQFATVGPLAAWIMHSYLEQPRQAEQKTAKQLNDERVADVLQRQMQLMRTGQPGEPAAAPPQSEAQPGPAPETMSTPGPRGPAKISLRPRQAVGRQNNIRSILTTMEKRHMQDRGSYAEDLEALVANYSTDPTERDELLKLVMQGALRARKTVAGVEIWQQNPNGEWVYEEVRR